MFKSHFLLKNLIVRIYPLDSSCFYVIGNYAVVAGSVTGDANFQSWINASGNGIGIMTINIPAQGLFFVSTLDRYENNTFQHIAFGLSGGIFQDPCIKRLVEYGSMSFRYISKNKIDCKLRAYKLRPDAPENIPFYQNYVLTDSKIVTNAIREGDLNSVFRVGELTIRNAVDNTIVGTNFFENYATTDDNRGIGLSVYLCENQVIYSFLSLQFSPSIQDPDSTVSIEAVSAAGQKYLKSFIQGVDQTTLNGTNYFETITGVSRDILSKNQTTVECVLTDLKVNIFRLQPDEPKAVVRLGTYVIINNLTDRIPIGKVDFQTYVTSNQEGIGTVVIRFNDRKGCIFGVYSTQFDSPVVIEPRAAQVGFTAGQGYFSQLFNGYAELESIPFSTDRKAKLTFALHP